MNGSDNKNDPDIQKNFEDLANAIILQAVEDCRLRDREEDLLEIDLFFRSRWFTVLSKVDPEYLIGKLRKEKENHEKTQTEWCGKGY